MNGVCTYYQETISGKQKVEVRSDDEGLRIFFVQNEIKFKPVAQDRAEAIVDSLGLSNEDIDENYSVIRASAGSYRILLPLKSKQMIQGLKPDYVKLKEISKADQLIGCFVFTMLKADKEFEAYARMFAPVIGVNEDIVNGNSCGCLAAYLLEDAGREINELRLTVQQGQSLHRAGTVWAIAKRVNNKIETSLGGTAVISWKGEFSF